MKKRALLLLLVVTLMVPLTAHSISAKDELFSVKGVGILKCEDYLKIRKSKSVVNFKIIGWIGGFITATNRYMPDTYDISSWYKVDSLAKILDNHCTQRPESPVVSAVMAIVQLLHSQRVQAFSPGREAKVGDKTIRIYEEIIKRVQKKLVEKGFYKGKIDGAFGPGTQKAIAAFQTKIRFVADGLPTQMTLFRLFEEK